MKRPGRILPVIVFSQFAGTSLWFAGNAILPDIQKAWQLGDASLGWMTSSVQLGFIAGTFLFAFLTLADRYPGRLIFLICSVIGGFTNLSIIFIDGNLVSLITLRFFTGFFLAGIYPVGMKIAAEWYRKGLGKALGYLVGALVIGTAFPHLIRGLANDLHWEKVMLYVSGIAITGGVLMYLLVPEGPYKKSSSGFSFKAVVNIFKEKDFRHAAFGYFGHMWELYAIWTFVPFILIKYAELNHTGFNVSTWSFIIIGAGALGCVLGGYASKVYGSVKVAFVMLFVSGICCLISPILFDIPYEIFMLIMVIWGFTVVADSPQFSTLNALTAPKALIGTGLTMVTGIGFAITIFSIELLNTLKDVVTHEMLFLLLIPGPVFGLITLIPLIRKEPVMG